MNCCGHPAAVHHKVAGDAYLGCVVCDATVTDKPVGSKPTNHDPYEVFTVAQRTVAERFSLALRKVRAEWKADLEELWKEQAS